MTDVSRRTALGTLAAMCLPWPAAVRAADAISSFSFIVVSDTHLGRGDDDSAARQWERTAKEIDDSAGDFVLHLGDVVDNGREGQYAVYKDIRKTIRKPVHEIPGNHDPQELFARHVRKDADTTFDHKGVRFLLLNNSRTDSFDGFVSAAQLTWLDGQLADAVRKNLFTMLAMHVAAHDNAAPDVGVHVKPADGQKELYAVLARHAGRVLALLHGHFHCGLRGWEDRDSLQEVVFPSALFNVDRRLGQAPGYHLPEFRPGFTLMGIGKDGLTLRYKPVGVAETRDRVCPLPKVRQ